MVASEIRARGCAVVPGVLSPGEVAMARAALGEVFAAEADVAEGRGWRTSSRWVAYALPAKHPTFLDLCTHPGLLALSAAILGPDRTLSSFNGFTTLPGGGGQPLHADHPAQTPGLTCTLHLVCALDDFTEANGATRVVPGSHQQPAPARRRAEPGGEGGVVALEAPAGSVVAFDGALRHGAGPNGTGEGRRALHVFFARPWVQPHWDLVASLRPEVASALGDEQRRVLGAGARPRRYDLGSRQVEAG